MGVMRELKITNATNKAGAQTWCFAARGDLPHNDLLLLLMREFQTLQIFHEGEHAVIQVLLQEAGPPHQAMHDLQQKHLPLGLCP